MCTVTFIPSRDGVYLTSNRDEKHSRKTAREPGTHLVNGYELLYPVDSDSGGSWIAVRENGDIAVLLNGGFVNHVPALIYGKSRGLVLIELISNHEPLAYFKHHSFKTVAPFTIVLYAGSVLMECRWDGFVKSMKQLSVSVPHIWSSATLYTPEIIAERETWFNQWLTQTKDYTTDSILRFHRFGGKGDIANDLVINRQDALYTVSITSIHLSPLRAAMYYFDMKQNKTFSGEIDIQKRQRDGRPGPAASVLYRLKKIRIIIHNWEYWPSSVLYAPLYLYWLWLSLKARSFFFFSTANPQIENAGFTNERKSRIYAMLPQAYYPKTVLCNKGQPLENICGLLHRAAISYPMIAKPDIGERGTGVKLLQNNNDLENYSANSPGDFLLQEFISYENEVGIFYYRIPGEQTGRISGIVGKEFLQVTGDGITSIADLLKRNDRFFLQLALLKKEYGAYLETVLSDGEEVELVPYGNHARGARFIDLSHLITEKLMETIEIFCQQVPEFYFGRLDIRFRSWEDLCEGKHFSVIELNGAGSEPTHMYDSAHSVFYAWKEIIRHWKILFRISMINAEKNGLKFMRMGAGIKMLKEHSRHMRLLSSPE